MDNFLDQQLPLGLVLVFVQNWLKQQKWFPWLTYQSTKMNHVFAIVVSGLATFGLHVSHTGNFTQGGSILLTFPAGTVILAGLWHWVQQYSVSKGIYVGLSTQLNPPAAQQPSAVIETADIKPIGGTKP
jgi:hypothetical protein